jgi:(E)-4-hydroxy-3-methylbut-2-enyl-diphosphate synthase
MDFLMITKYCESIYQTQRRPTRAIQVGNIGVGGQNPIRIQSMTTSNTRDVQATVEQVIRLADAGCEIVRVTVQGMKEAEACEQIKNLLLQKNYQTPLVADIHFFPPAALQVAEFVDKVRINPGNFVDKRASFKILTYDDASYALELEKIEEKFTPLVEKCKRLKRAMRIGTNHGSLSDRIMNRYGDTPAGMVESALEFARICHKLDYHEFIFSMKASNPQVMIQAYRLLTSAMYTLGWDYPLHLGVTEAGEGEDGRIKSAMGIGSLLLDGLGDTIRVSLTEDPWCEIDPCQRLIRLATQHHQVGVDPFNEKYRLADQIQRRSVHFDPGLALHKQGSVLINVQEKQFKQPTFYQQLGCEGSLGLPKLKTMTADAVIIENFNLDRESTQRLQALREIGVGVFSSNPGVPGLPLLTLEEAHQQVSLKNQTHRFALNQMIEDASPLVIKLQEETVEEWEILRELKPALIIFSPSHQRLHRSRQFFEWLQDKQLAIPVILHFDYKCSAEDLTLLASMECGALLCDGLGEGLWLEGSQDINQLRQLSFSILQAARMRMVKTDFISCPSCGRTLFDLQDVTRRIQKRTAHLPGVKIAIMGCIVNGPGEMADADFGYVGSKPGKIDLYVGKKCVEKDIDFAQADDRLIELIKTHNQWIEPVIQEERVGLK